MVGVGVMDLPDARKAHARPVPKGGGVGVVVAFLAGTLVLYRYAQFARLADPYFLGVILAATAIAVVAFLDDIRDWSFAVKLGAQAAGRGGRGRQRAGGRPAESALAWGPVALGWAAAPLTLACGSLFATNAVNFIDGLNGLAAGVCGIDLRRAGGHGGRAVWRVVRVFRGAAAGWPGWWGSCRSTFPAPASSWATSAASSAGSCWRCWRVAAGRFQGVELSVLLVPMLLFGGAVRRGVHAGAPGLLAGRPADAGASEPPVSGRAPQSGMPATVAVTLVHWGFAAVGRPLLRAVPLWHRAIGQAAGRAAGATATAGLGGMGRPPWRARRASGRW